VGYLSFNFDVSVSFENFLVNNLNFTNLLSGFSDVNWFFYNFFDLNVLFRPRNLNWLFNFNYFSFLNNNVFVVFYFNNFLFIQRNDFFHFDIV